MRDQRRGRGLAVGPRDRDAALVAHHLGEHLRAVDHRDVASDCGRAFRVLDADRGGIDDDVGVGDLIGVVPDRAAMEKFCINTTEKTNVG